MTETDNDGEFRILIVDDEPTNIALLVGVLGNLYRVQAAQSGEKALELADMEPRPDLILLDVMMPDMNGHEVCRRLKAEDSTSGIPVIFVTGHDDEEDETHGFALGAADYITKPIRPALVRARIHTHLALRERNRSLEALVEARTAQIMEANRQLSQEKLEREQAMQRIEHILGHDNLTRLPNRMRFLKALGECLANASLHERPLSVIAASIDRFAEVNDEFGADKADRTLQEVALRVMRVAGAEHLCSRTGPTSFAVVVEARNSDAHAHQERADKAAAQLKESLSAPFSIEGSSIKLSVKSALQHYSGTGQDALGLLSQADAAAKRS